MISYKRPHKHPMLPKDHLDYHFYDLWITTHPVAPLRPGLKQDGFVTARELVHMKNNERVKVAGVLVMIHTPPTRSGRRVMFITLEDETGLIDLVAFENVQRRWARSFLLSEFLPIEGIVKKEGPYQNAVSVVIRRVL